MFYSAALHLLALLYFWICSTSFEVFRSHMWKVFITLLSCIFRKSSWSVSKLMRKKMQFIVVKNLTWLTSNWNRPGYPSHMFISQCWVIVKFGLCKWNKRYPREQMNKLKSCSEITRIKIDSIERKNIMQNQINSTQSLTHCGAGREKSFLITKINPIHKMCSPLFAMLLCLPRTFHVIADYVPAYFPINHEQHFVFESSILKFLKNHSLTGLARICWRNMHPFYVNDLNSNLFSCLLNASEQKFDSVFSRNVHSYSHSYLLILWL